MFFTNRLSTAEGSSSGRVPAVVAWVFAFGVSLVVVSVLVVTSSIAAFGDTTDNTGNSFSTGTVTLTDDDVGALFTVTNLIPGQSVQDCITVTYSGSIADPSAVRIYSGGYTDSGDLDTHLDITIDEGRLPAGWTYEYTTSQGTFSGPSSLPLSADTSEFITVEIDSHGNPGGGMAIFTFTSQNDANVVASAKLVQYTEITAENIDSFHFHGAPEDYPLSAVIAVPSTTPSSKPRIPAIPNTLMTQ